MKNSAFAAGFAAALDMLNNPPESVLKATRECEPFVTAPGNKPWTPGQIVAATVMRAAASALAEKDGVE